MTTLLEACEAAEHWLAEEAAEPGQAKPDEILRVLRAAIRKAKHVKDPAQGAWNACRLLIYAYNRGEDSGSMDWDDVNLAYAEAVAAVKADGGDPETLGR